MNNKQFIPHYDRLTCCWKVDFPDGSSEIGDLLYVSCEYLRTCLYFPYDTTETIGKEYHGHSHSFDGVLQALYSDPTGFTIKGHEENYSLQERELLEQLQKKLKEDLQLS